MSLNQQSIFNMAHKFHNYSDFPYHIKSGSIFFPLSKKREMKKIYFILSIFTIFIFDQVHGQDIMTIGEVFNFAVGDEFHIVGESDMEPPNADRITIIDKYYSSNGENVYYVESHDAYFTTIELEPEFHLEYHFWTDTITVYYTNLDSSILNYDIGFENNLYCK